MNKSEAIRQYKAQHPDSGPSEIAKELRKQGFDVTPGFVSVVMSNHKTETRVGCALVCGFPKTVNLDEILKVKALVDELGIQKVRQLINAIEELRE